MKYEVLGNNKQADLNLYVCERDVHIEPGTCYGPVIRDSYIIECCTFGEGSIIINGTAFDLRPGDCMILFPGDTITHITGDKPRNGVWCAVKGIKISSYLADVGISSQHPYVPRDAFPKILKIINKLIKMKNDNDAGADLRRTACIHEIFGEILRFAKKENDKGAYIKKAVYIIETRYAEQLSVAGLATDIGLERCYFSTLFKKVTGISPQQYIADFRIKKACELLLTQDCSVSEIACAIGIAPDRFCRVFKNKMSITPGQYRKKEKSILTALSDEWVCGR